MRFMLFDRVEAAERGRSIEAVMNVNLAGAYFANHFARKPVFPATLVVEALAQVGGMLNILNHAFTVEMVLMLVDGVVFEREVGQGDQLRLHVQMMYDHPYGATMAGEAFVGEARVAAVERMVFAHEKTADPDKIRKNRERFAYQCGPVAAELWSA